MIGAESAVILMSPNSSIIWLMSIASRSYDSGELRVPARSLWNWVAYSPTVRGFDL